ncbi:MAG: hypothetical protein FWF91_03335 [Coriobacteriia bacterium]|nr:hypothetical protein [Coriobacteriia bacterium]
MVTALIAALLAGCLTGCVGGSGSGGSSDGNGGGSGGGSGGSGSTVEEPAYVQLPITVVSLEHEYTILKLEVTEDEMGYTVISCTGKGFENMVFNANAGFMIPVYCAIIEGDKEIEFNEYNTKGKERNIVEFTFYGKLDPDAVVFYPQEDYENRSIVKIK